MKTVLVTGVAGFVGSNLAPALLKRGYRVVGVDNFDDTYPLKFKEAQVAPFLHDPNFELVHGDIRDKDAMQVLFERVRRHPAIQARSDLPSR